ncbi:hypothetical protein NUW54_g10378 [Trametes sanguinea]|uniref:Uncharacterized protein n=1 Tax=Trametes sanguinea TaxID=158606 RepID=A0ACC1NZH6_9APHY|nr:hypothetical protein NUW54_g10378 [Trametes sanguinea]
MLSLAHATRRCPPQLHTHANARWSPKPTKWYLRARISQYSNGTATKVGCSLGALLSKQEVHAAAVEFRRNGVSIQGRTNRVATWANGSCTQTEPDDHMRPVIVVMEPNTITDMQSCYGTIAYPASARTARPVAVQRKRQWRTVPGFACARRLEHCPWAKAGRLSLNSAPEEAAGCTDSKRSSSAVIVCARYAHRRGI